MKTLFVLPFSLLILLFASIGCKSPTSPGSDKPEVTILPSSFHGIEFVADTFKAKISNHDFAQTYFEWNVGDTTIIYYPPQPSFQVIHIFKKPGVYVITVKAHDIYSNEVIASNSITAAIDTARSSVKIVPQFYDSTLSINTFGELSPFSVSVKTSLPPSELYEFWDYGDGTTDSFIQDTAFHVFPHTGSYRIKVDVYQKSGVYVGSDTASITINFPPVTLDSIKRMQRAEAFIYVDSSYPISQSGVNSLLLSIAITFTGPDITSSWNNNDFSLEQNIPGSYDYRLSGTLSNDAKTLKSLTVYARDSGYKSVNFEYGFSASDIKIIATTGSAIVFSISADAMKNSVRNFNYIYNQGMNPQVIGQVDRSDDFIRIPPGASLPAAPTLVFVFSRK